jgi:hypothetical protein
VSESCVTLCGSYANDPAWSAPLLTFLQVNPSDFGVFMILLAVLALGYRLLSLLILAIRIRFVKPA